MAILSNSDYTEIKHIIFRDPTATQTFTDWGLTKSVWKSVFQAAEDWFVNGFLSTPTNSFKAALEVESGSCTNGQAKQVGWAWMGWRNKLNP